MSATTPNLGLIKPELNDNISPEPFNSNFEILDTEIGELKKDYVISQGVSGIWYYRKWANGTYECWAKTTGTTGAWRWWTGKQDWLMYAGNMISVAYPITFIEAPLEFTSCSINGTDCWLDKASGGNSTTKSASYWMTTNRDTLVSSSLPYTFNIHVIGKWK